MLFSLKEERAWLIPEDFRSITECTRTIKSFLIKLGKENLGSYWLFPPHPHPPQQPWALSGMLPEIYQCKILVSEPLNTDWSEESRGGAIQSSFPALCIAKRNQQPAPGCSGSLGCSRG